MSQENNSEPTRVLIRREMVEMAVMWVLNRFSFTIDRPGMNPRSLSEKIDDGIMGEIASVAVIQFLTDLGRNVVAYDQVRKDQYKDPDPGWDILSSHEDFDHWKANSLDGKTKPDHAFSFSIKSSRIPKADEDDIDVAISKRDFKIFKKSASIDHDITADFEVQVYFSLQTSQFDSSLKIEDHQVKNKDIEGIMSRLQLMERYSECFLSGAVSRQKLIKYSNALPPEKRFWTSNHVGYSKSMWFAPLTLGQSFKTLIT